MPGLSVVERTAGPGQGNRSTATSRHPARNGLAQWAEAPVVLPGKGDVRSHLTSLRDRLTMSPRLRRTSVNRLKNLPA